MSIRLTIKLAQNRFFSPLQIKRETSNYPFHTSNPPKTVTFSTRGSLYSVFKIAHYPRLITDHPASSSGFFSAFSGSSELFLFSDSRNVTIAFRSPRSLKIVTSETYDNRRRLLAGGVTLAVGIRPKNARGFDVYVFWFFIFFFCPSETRYRSPRRIRAAKTKTENVRRKKNTTEKLRSAAVRRRDTLLLSR